MNVANSAIKHPGRVTKNNQDGVDIEYPILANFCSLELLPFKFCFTFP